MANIPYYPGSVTRTIIGETTVYPNNYKYSTMRDYQNGTFVAYDTQAKTYDGKGFLQSAFSTEEQALIAVTAVDNSERSTNPDSNASEWNGGVNNFACANTFDKIFLLSLREVTRSDYGFSAYNVNGAGNTRIRFPTDFALANYCYKDSSANYGSWLWLRSPYFDVGLFVRASTSSGYISYTKATDDRGGIVPALCIDFADCIWE